MPIPAEIAPQVCNGNGSTTAFTVPFLYYSKDHVKVVHRASDGTLTNWTLGTQFTLTDAGVAAGGTLTTASGYTVASGAKLYVWLDVPFTQETTLKNSGPQSIDAFHELFDTIVQRLAVLEEALARAFKLPLPDTGSDMTMTVEKASLLGKLAQFDDTTGKLIGVDAVDANLVLLVAASETTAGKAELATDAEAETGTDDTRILTPAKAGGWLGKGLLPGGRLSLTTAVPVTVSDVTAATTIYYALDQHELVPLWTGTRWRAFSFAELSLALDNNAAHTGYQQSGKNFDLFIDYNSGTPRLVTGPAWTSDTARASAIARLDGRWTNSGSMTVRFDASASTATMAANTGLYVGTMRASADGQAEDSLAKRFLWNMYNRRMRSMRVADQTDSWTYTSATIRQANNAAANQLAFVRGLDEDAVSARAKGTCICSSGSARPQLYIGLDATNALGTGAFASRGFHNDAAGRVQLHAQYNGYPGLGYHFLAWLEADVAALGTTTWYGDDGQTININGINGEMLA